MKRNIEKNTRKGIKTKQDDVFFTVAVNASELPAWYGDFFESIKSEISVSRRRVMVSANTQMMMMYYHIGQYTLKQQEVEGWGSKMNLQVEEKLAGIGFSVKEV